jgi:hypothetical protein
MPLVSILSTSLIIYLLLAEYLMVIGGEHINHLNVVNIVDLISPDPLSNPVFECNRQLKPFPKNVSGHAAANLLPGMIVTF